MLFSIFISRFSSEIRFELIIFSGMQVNNSFIYFFLYKKILKRLVVKGKRICIVLKIVLFHYSIYFLFFTKLSKIPTWNIINTLPGVLSVGWPLSWTLALAASTTSQRLGMTHSRTQVISTT